jgi:DNA-binding LacI/PurR family transcriptional regulator
MQVIPKKVGRVSGQLARQLRDHVHSGKVMSGDYLPTVRELCAEHGMSIETVQRAVHALEAEGLVAAEPGRGFRVLARANDPLRGCPLAYLSEVSAGGEAMTEFRSRLLGHLRDAAGARGWSLLAVQVGSQSPASVAEQLKKQRAFAAAVDSDSAELLSALRDAGIPVLMLDAWVDGADHDAILQDGQGGGVLAVRHLVELGCRRLAWFGSVDGNAHTLDRLGGALSALCVEGLAFDAQVATDRSNDVDRARELLSRRDRPEAILALWQSDALALARAAADLKLEVGKDFRMVGWCPEELFDAQYAPGFGAGAVPPTITWSIRTMAETAVARLAERRENPTLAPLRVKVPVRLRPAGRG